MCKKPETPKIGVGVLIRKKGTLLLGMRKGAHGEGQWSLPGGHMELGEDFTEVCAREVKEETGITIEGVKKLGFTNDIFEEEGLHYVTLFFEALWDGKQQAQLMEPDKTIEWKWFDFEKLPNNIFQPLLRFLIGLS
jgi:8-oxo-dGTP diphosphatase